MTKIKCLLFTTLILIFTFEQSQAKIKQLSKYKSHLNVKHHHSKIKHKYLAPHFQSLRNDCPGFSERIDKADVQYEECAARIFSNESTLMCTKMETLTLNCMEHVYSKIVDDCYGEQSKGVFSLVLQSFASVFEYLCKQTGETLIELSRSCLWNDLEEKTESLSRCEEVIKEKAMWYRDHGFATTTICRDLSGFRDCIKTRVTITCKCNKTREAFVGLYDASIAPCKNILNN
ncbi:uncharacterized protein LOC135136347 [Zophobas morio]|uniref:uncharacterized protein LOC135136347 n=1 Tax=Zophobas morio TaxID=2755281 RepID=UPI0030827C37